jgi:4-hydroxy-2-oxoheptanedioate aldolase
MIPSRVLERLRAGGCARVTGVCRLTDPWAAELIGKIGFDAVWYDLEHRTASEASAAGMAVGCRAGRTDLMVRVRKSDYSMPMRMLEVGANGLMVPHIRSAEEARRWVDWCRFPPLGSRGFDGAGADADYMLAGPLEHIRHANDNVFLAFQIEDRSAVEAIDEIAAVDGFDILFVGPADLSLSLGVPFELNHPACQRAIDRVAAAAARSGKWWGLPVDSAESARRYLERGARFLAYGSDHALLVEGFRKLFDELNGAVAC